jgi:hypothetical protein
LNQESFDADEFYLPVVLETFDTDEFYCLPVVGVIAAGRLGTP